MRLVIALCLVSLLCLQLADARGHGWWKKWRKGGSSEESNSRAEGSSEAESDESSEENQQSHGISFSRFRFDRFALRQCRRELNGGSKCQNSLGDKFWWKLHSLWACQKWGIWKSVIHQFLKSTGSYANYCQIDSCETGVGHICKLEAVNQETGNVFLSHSICEGGCGELESCRESDLDCTGVTFATPLKFALCRMGKMFRGCYKLKVYRCQCAEPVTEPPTTVEPETEPPTTVAPTEPPTTVAPTEPPTTVASTEPPTTVAPTEFPTTTAPSLNATTKAGSSAANSAPPFLNGLDGVGFPNF